MRRIEKSHLLSVNSSLFEFRPLPEAVLRMRDWYEEGKIHETLTAVMVRSKSEVIIANMLAERGVPFRYEVPLFAADGTFYLPDFTITWRGEEWYWEHIGMLDKEKYQNHWKTKERWYKKNFSGRLITTLERRDLTVQADKTIKEYFL
jgi:hypothetical protein